MSGGVMEIAISAINIGSRHRREMGDVDALAKSIEEIGLLHPVVLDMEHRLIAGARRIAAFQALGRATIPARVLDMENIVLGEHAENELRKDFTPSERVAIGEEIERILGNRQGQRTDLAESEPVQKIAQVAKGEKTRKAAAKAAGFGNAETYRQAKAVVKKAAPQVREAMDKDELSVNAAFKLSKLPPEEQAAAIKGPRPWAHIPGLTDELAIAADKANVANADAYRLATLPVAEQRELARDPRAMKGRVRALRMEDRQKKEAQDKEKARAAKAEEKEEAFVIAKIVEAFKAAQFDQETVRRISDVIGNSRTGWFRMRLDEALCEAFDLYDEDDDEAQAAE
jgi:ParB-like chromosome segregation protein Spo0J